MKKEKKEREEKTKETKKQTKKIVLYIVLSLLLIYLIYAVYLLVKQPTDQVTVENGTLYLEETDIGYIIRNEQVVTGNNYKNGMEQIKTEGEKTAKGDSIYRYYSKNEDSIKEQIAELDVQIQEALEGQTESLSSDVRLSDVKLLENQLDEKIQELSKITDVSQITEYEKQIEDLVSRKAKLAGETSPAGSHLKELYTKRTNLEQQLNSGAEYITAPISGIVSYKVDGLEDQLKPDNLANITDTYLESLDLKTGQIISSSTEYGKVIDNFKCYIAVIINSELAQQAKIGDKVTLRISTTEEDEAEIVQINEGSGTRTIIFELNNMSQNLINYRKIAVDIIWWQKSGYKVPNQAIITKNVNGQDLNYIIRNKNGVQTEILVKVEKQNDKFSIISSYETKELQELGFNEDDIKNYKKISNYDEIILNNDKK